VVNVIDAIQPSRLLEFATAQAGPMAQAASASGGPPGVVGNARSTLQAIPESAESQEALFGLRPGDMLMPVIDLYRQLMQTVDGFTDEILNPAAALLHELLAVRVQSLFPSSVEFEVEATLDLVAGEFDARLAAGRLLPAADAFQTFVEAFTAKSADLPDAEAAVAQRIGTLLAVADPLTLAPAPAQSDGVLAACAQVRAGVRLEGCRMPPGIWRACRRWCRRSCSRPR